MDEPEEQERGTGRNQMLCQALLIKLFCKKKKSSLTTITYYVADSWEVDGLILSISQAIGKGTFEALSGKSFKRSGLSQ